MTHQFADPEDVMRRAIELAARGSGRVEPNPTVGAVIVDAHLRLVAEGFHQRFGGPHAEVHALEQAGGRAAGTTLFVTLEPCPHQGQTPPCTDAIIRAGIRKVVIGIHDPSPHVDGGGIARLKSAGIEVDVGLLESEAARLAAPFVKLVTTETPYVHAKWAMTLDGKLASRTGESQWISNLASREIVHRLRGRMDAVLVGSATALSDDPLLTARPAGPRVATRIVVDSDAKLPATAQLVRTLDQAPVLVACCETAPPENVNRLQQAGVEVLQLPVTQAGGESGRRRTDLTGLLHELGRRRMTNVLIEGGGVLLGAFFDASLIDEVHVFISPKLLGGKSALTPLAGIGLSTIPDVSQLDNPSIEIVKGDVYIHGPIRCAVNDQQTGERGASAP